MRHIDMLHIERAELWPRATDHIDEMIALVRTLEEKGYTYRTADGVYFDTAVFAPYCTYAGLDPESLQAGSRVDMGEKRNATDFALWKFSPAGRKRQMEWDSPWGVGFPGWHIECSAMALKYLDQPVDIHCGGTDHIRVHHTNEVAQVEAATDTRFVNYWLHGEFLVMKNAKMAKSEGNFVTLDTLVERGYSPLAFRMLCCTAHYRSPLTFTWEALDGAAQSLVTMQLEVANAVADVLGEMQHDAQADALEAVREDTGITGPFFEALCDDLNVPRAIGCVWDVIRHQDIPARKKCAALQCFDEVLGLDLLQLARRRTVTHVAQPDGGDITIIAYRDMQQQEIDETVAAIRERTQARAQKDFARADTIRDELAAANKQLQDLPGKKTQCSVL
jgi:cysteinyl-tRNA synthetase